ncbi:hypothetical protein ACFO5R_05765 [Halosolutus amylolyticus]|uniref:Uncharacterized protein n=1 Tax=Halosolutus amylolyticus TaxID=2932267 RepID=A0ABD5PLE3_9EURY|nr:hypothetical protein [Halosolutus amylolyticus]
MVVSAAIGEFAGILADLEQLHDVRSVAIPDTDAHADEVIACVEIEVPIVDDDSVTDDVTIEATDTELTDGAVEVTLEFSIPTTSDESRLDGTAVDSLAGGETPGGTADAGNGQAAYKDPDALRAVYEEYDSFPAMTAALGVDVTSETVRRYMVKHDIHEPEGGDRGGSDRANATDAGDDRTTDGEPPTTDSETTGDDAEGDDESPTGPPADSAFGDRSIAEILANADGEEDDPLVTDGVGVPRDLTVASLTEILDRSRTVSEVARALDLEYEQTRRVLNELGGIGFVTGRLGDSRDDVTVSEVARRVRDERATGE